MSRPVHADFLISTFDSLTNFLKLTLSRSVHANFFFGHQHLNIFKLLCTQEPPHGSSRAINRFYRFFFGWFLKTPTSHSSFVRNSFGIRTNRSEFGPIVQDSDQSFGIRTNCSGFRPIDRNSYQSNRENSDQSFVRSSFFVRPSFVVFRPPTLVHFLTALHTRTSSSEQHCSSSILEVFLIIPDSKIPWNGITVGYFRLFSSTYQIIRRNSVDWYYRRMTFRFPLAEH